MRQNLHILCFNYILQDIRQGNHQVINLSGLAVGAINIEIQICVQESKAYDHIWKPYQTENRPGNCVSIFNQFIPQLSRGQGNPGIIYILNHQWVWLIVDMVIKVINS